MSTVFHIVIEDLVYLSFGELKILRAAAREANHLEGHYLWDKVIEAKHAASLPPEQEPKTPETTLGRSRPEQLAEPGGIGLELKPRCGNCARWRKIMGDCEEGYCDRHKIYTDRMESYICHEAV